MVDLKWGWMAVFLLASPALGDIFVLQSGGRVSGEIANLDEHPRQNYVIQTDEGGRLTLNKSQIKQIIPQSAAERQYERIRSDYPETVDGQWRLAEWCRERSLFKQREVHLRRLLELDENHKQARAALGYSQIDGRWVTQEQIMQENGYVRYGGRWRLPQEVELLEKKRKNELAEKEWYRKLSRFRSSLNAGGVRAKEARESIQSIDDPYAVPALTQGLVNEGARQVKVWYIEALKRIGTPGALAVLASRALEDLDEEIRLTCLDQLVDIKNPAVTSQFVQGLKSKDNIKVNRAAVGLAYLKDPSAVSPLIEALVTTHKFKIVPSNPGAMTTGFSSDGSGNSMGGLGMGGNQIQIVKQEIANREVLEALVLLTGENFSFDVKAWKYWYASQHKPEVIDARRD